MPTVRNAAASPKRIADGMRAPIGAFLVAAMLSTATVPAMALDGCLVLLCLAAPSWRAIPQCVPPIRQLLRDLALGRAARNDSVCKKFLAIPGVGPLTSLAFKATIDDPRRFASSRTVPSHLGLTPRVYQSGEIDRSGHISKSGDKLLRYLLVEAATAMLLRSKKWCSIKSWGVRLAKRVGMSKAIVAVARKIAIVMHKIWLTGDDFRFGEASPSVSASVA